MTSEEGTMETRRCEDCGLELEVADPPDGPIQCVDCAWEEIHDE